ncbi:MAG: SLC13 family permease [Myxococcota bacterium]
MGSQEPIERSSGKDSTRREFSPRRWTGIVLTPLAGLVAFFAPLDLDSRAACLLAIFATVVVAWITEILPIEVTSLLIAPALVATGITDAKSAYAPYADPLLFLFVGGFFLARAMNRHGLDSRLAYALVRLVRGEPWRCQAALMCAGLLLSMWISNTAAAAILVPILLKLFDSNRADPHSDPRALSQRLLAMAYTCSIGGMGTLIGSPPNAITARLLQSTGIDFGFIEWLMIGLPTAVILAVCVYPVAIGGRDTNLAQRASLPKESSRAKWSKGEQCTAIAFILAILGWIVPSLLKAMHLPIGTYLVRVVPSGSIALFASAILFFLRDERGERVLPWNDAIRIDWGIIMLFGGGIALGTQIMETGLAAKLGSRFVSATGVSDVWTLTALVVVFTVVFTEACSNTAASNMLVPLVIAVAQDIGVSPVAPSIAVGLAASCAFMMPIATGPNAVVFGSGRVQLTTMIKRGFMLNIVAIIVVFSAVRILCPLFGWMD